ncbi:hypothetical protein Efla_002001 [Eimeria flavescens]
MQAKGEHAIGGKLEGRFSPIFALAEFSSQKEKEKACCTYLRAFGVPCIDRLVYPEDAAVKTTLVATNIPFVLTAEEVVRILSFALVQNAEVPGRHPVVCRIRMTNPRLFGYDQVSVEARSDAEEPFLLRPLHGQTSANGAECSQSSSELLTPNRNSSVSSKDQKSRNGASYLPVQKAPASHLGQLCLDGFKRTDTKLPVDAWRDLELPFVNKVSAYADDNVFIPGFSQPASGVRNLHFYFDVEAYVGDKDPSPLADIFLTNRLVLNNDGMFVLRFASFEAAEAAVRRCRGFVIYDSKAMLLFSPRRCVYHNGEGRLVDFVIPEGNFDGSFVKEAGASHTLFSKRTPRKLREESKAANRVCCLQQLGAPPASQEHWNEDDRQQEEDASNCSAPEE